MIDILGIQSFSFEETATVFKETGRRTIQIFLHSCIINMKNKQLFNRKKLVFQCVWRKCFAYVRSSVTNISTCFNLYFVKSVRIRSLLIFFSLMNTQAQNCWYGSVCAFDQNFVRFFLVRILPYSEWIRIFSPNMGKCGSEKTPYLGNFHTVLRILIHSKSCIKMTYSQSSFLKQYRLKNNTLSLKVKSYQKMYNIRCPSLP